PPQSRTAAHETRHRGPRPDGSSTHPGAEGGRHRSAGEGLGRQGAEVRAARAGMGRGGKAHPLGGAMEHRASGAGRLSAFGVIAGALFVIGLALAWLGVVRGLVAFVLFGLGGLTGVVVGVTAVLQAARGRGLGRGGAVALVVGVVFLALASRGAGKPRINDFTTDPADPPALAP